MSNDKNYVIEIKNLSFHYEKRLALEKVNLAVERGAFLGLVGPNGSGKSTLIKCILGLLKPDEGEIHLFGTPIKKFKDWHKIGYVSQKANSFNSGFPATVFEVVSMGLFGKIGPFKFLSKKDKQKVYKAIADVGMSEYVQQNIGELSGGQQQRVFIARALVSDPELLILDEPTVGVDTKSVESFYEMLRKLNKEQNITLMLVTHDVEAMVQHVSHVACINKHIHFYGDTKQFAINHEISSLYGLDVQLLTHHHQCEVCDRSVMNHD